MYLIRIQTNKNFHKDTCNKSKKVSKGQEPIQSSTTPVPRYQMGKSQNHTKHHKQEPKDGLGVSGYNVRPPPPKKRRSSSEDPDEMIMRHFIWIFAFCQSARLLVSGL